MARARSADDRLQKNIPFGPTSRANQMRSSSNMLARLIRKGLKEIKLLGGGE